MLDAPHPSGAGIPTVRAPTFSNLAEPLCA
jgi:hypothetical protein